MDSGAAHWQKSSYSGGNGAACVEVADSPPEMIAIRDSKNRGGAVLVFTRGEWGAFVAAMKGFGASNG